MTFDKDNIGLLFKNEKKQSDNHPDRKGEGKINGIDYWIAGWVKKDKNGNAFLSLSFTPKDKPKTESQSENEDSPF